jgi:hypothetical protein
MPRPRAHPYGRYYSARYRVVGIEYGRKFLFGYAQTQQRAQQLLAELKRMGLRGEIIHGGRCESNPCRPERNPRIRRSGEYEEYDIPPGVSERELEVAIDTFERFHSHGPNRVEKISIPAPRVLTNLGDWIGVIYFSDKWKNQKKLKQYHRGKRGQGYIHEFKDKKKRRLMFIPSTKNSEYGTLIAMGPAKVTEHGVEDIV